MFGILKITKLGVVDAFKLHEKAVTGDLKAARQYILYSAWKKISVSKDHTKKQKLKALAAFADGVEVTWQTASN